MEGLELGWVWKHSAKRPGGRAVPAGKVDALQAAQTTPGLNAGGMTGPPSVFPLQGLSVLPPLWAHTGPWN